MIGYRRFSTFSTDKLRQIEVPLLFFIFLITMILRIQYVNNTLIYHPLRADAFQYVTYAYNIVNYGTFSNEFSSTSPRPDSFRSPGYPLFIAIAFIFGGDKGFYPIVIYVQIFLSSIMIFLTYYIGINFLSRRWSIISAILVAFSPHLVSMTNYVLTETLFSFILLASIFIFYKLLKLPNWFLSIISALFFGYGYLINETLLFIPFLLIFSIYCYNKVSQKTYYRKLLLFIIIFSLFPICWAIRNKINLPDGTSKGYDRALISLSHGTYPDFIYNDPKFKYYPYMEDPLQPVFVSSFDNFIKILWARFKERPVRYLSWYLFEKPYYFWSWNDLQSCMGENCEKEEYDIYVYPVEYSLYHTSLSANISKKIMKYIHPVFLILAIIGIPFLINEIRQKLSLFCDTPYVIFIILIYYTLFYTIFAPWPRYSVPLRPELYLFSIYSFVRLKNAFVRYYGKVFSIS